MLGGVVCKKELLCDSYGITIMWLGRVEGFKINSIILIYKEILAAAKAGNKISFVVVGDGGDLDLLKEKVVTTPMVKVEYMGEVVGDELEYLLISQCDILIAMGTSALEGAKLGVKTLLVDVFLGFVPDMYNFKWLYETEEYSLGRILYRDDNSLLEIGCSLSSIIAGDGWGDVSVKCKDYVNRNHTIPLSAELLLKAYDNGLLTYSVLVDNVGPCWLIRFKSFIRGLV